MAKHAARHLDSRATVSAEIAAALEKAWTRVWADDPKRPILSALRREYLKRLTAMVTDAKSETKQAELVQDLKTLGGWIYDLAQNPLDVRSPRTHILSVSDDGVRMSDGPPHLHEILGAAGLNQEAASTIIQVLAEPLQRPGAPIRPAMRRLAIEAIEEKERDPKFSWQRFANAHCNCGNKEHDIRCKERIRQVAMELQRLLKRLGV